MRGVMGRVVVVAFLGVFPAAGTAQSAPGAIVTGTVRDTAGGAIAQVQLIVAGARTLTDSAGRFSLVGLPAGPTMLSVRRLGYAPLETRLRLQEGGVDTLDVTLVAVPGQLPELTTDAEAMERSSLAGFYRRREIGNGFFFNRRELDSTRVVRISDVLRRLPGVRLVPDRSGRVHLRMSRSGNCPPDFWIDGQRAPYLGVDDLPLRDLQAMEVYRGASGVPPEFNNRLGNPACGVVVIWTRLPG